jgi:hypothetical protein
MRREVIVQFSPAQCHELVLHADDPDLAPDEGRRWLDREFVANDCEPIRASGKVLIADKVLVLADTVGPDRFAADPAWARAFAIATLSALCRPVVRVDVASRALSY